LSTPLRFCLAFAAPVIASLAFIGTANARDYKIGCVSGDCVIVDDTGRISYFKMGDSAVADGVDQLRAPDTVRIRPPLNVACATTAAADRCVITDADGHVWVGPPRPGAPYGAPVTRMAVPGPR